VGERNTGILHFVQDDTLFGDGARGEDAEKAQNKVMVIDRVEKPPGD
jgi:hypothetical protein